MQASSVVRHLEPLDADSPLENEAVLPSQFTIPTASKLNGVRRLMAAMLADAIHCYCGNGERRSVSGEATQWLFGPANSDLFGFENVCNELGIDAEALRAELTRWKASVTLDFCHAARRERRFSRWVAAA